MAQLGEIPGIQEFGNALMQYANMEQRQKHQAETERIAREGRAFQERKESAIEERALRSETETQRHHKATEDVAQKKYEADEAVRKEQQRPRTLDTILKAGGYDPDPASHGYAEYQAQEKLMVDSGFAEKVEGKPAITSLEKLENYKKMIATNADLAQNQAKIEIANNNKKLQDLTLKMQKLQDPTTGQVLPGKEKEYDALAIQRNNYLEIMPALKTTYAQAPLLANRNKALASIADYSKDGAISDADAKFFSEIIRRDPSKTDEIMKQISTTATNRQAREAGREDKQAFQKEMQETTMFPAGKDNPELSRNRQGKLFITGETDVPVSPMQAANLRIANQQMRQELKAGYTASANNQLQAIKSLVLPVDGKPSALDELKQMRAEAFAKPGDISVIRNELSKYAGKEVDDSQFKVLNKIKMALKKQFTSEPKLAAFWSKLQATAEQLGRYYSGGGNVTSDFKIRFAMELLDAGYQQKAFEAVVDTHANAMKHTQTILEQSRNNPAEQYRITVQSIFNGARLKAGKQLDIDISETPAQTPQSQTQASTATKTISASEAEKLAKLKAKYGVK